MTVTNPIGEFEVKLPHSIENLPPLIIGGAVFNNQYSDNPHKLPAKDILEAAFMLGLNAIDTSPYYGPSEEILGQALKELAHIDRQSFYICSKAGRVKLDDFDYSRESVRNSIKRSLKRLGTTYLDLVYMHDIEFVEESQIYEALKELKLLKDEGLILNFGVSGYPVKFLYKVALQAKNDKEIGPLDAILSYSNGCLQNTTLFQYYDKFFSDCGIKKLMNGSILSMSLLRSDITHSFHPAPQALKDKVQEIARILKQDYNGLELADLSTRFAIKNWLFNTGNESDDEFEESYPWNSKTSIVLGVSNLDELRIAVESYWQVKNNENNINVKDKPVVDLVQRLLGEKHLNETWESGIEGR
ncbi:D-threo-aldose 1-dehydrogenase [Scheffersomyces coipomensis]|uniref:D-threo-aldose 1-dehydrogenase n=1 Tax=Scheffersomyces coipomensis TaxID=1788519 RepID=UPI00315DC7CA